MYCFLLMFLLTHLSPPAATIFASDYSCHFPFVSIFLNVIHVLCLKDMQAKNQIKDFKRKKGIHFLSHEAVNFLPLLRGSMVKATPPPQKKDNCHVTNIFFFADIHTYRIIQAKQIVQEI